MRTTLHKVFWIWDFEKEEKWLEEMAAKGLSLVSVSFCTYTFEESAPSEYGIRLELLENVPTHVESKAYIKFIEETGAEYLGSVFRWVYFRKKKDKGEFELYSDYNSRIKHLNRMLVLLGIFAILELSLGISDACIYFSSGTIPNLVFAILLLSCGLLFCFGLLRINSKKRKLKKEQQLFE